MADVGSETTRRRLLESAVRRLEESSVSGPRRNAEWLLCEVLDCSRAELYGHPDKNVNPDEFRRFEDMLQRRLRREPLQYILGYTDFYRLRLRVTPAVLIPRPETEQVVEKALSLLSRAENPRILDVGTGSGCIALALKHERQDALVWGCDVSADALEIARENARTNGVDVSFFEADVHAEGFEDSAPGQLDLLISNPPYVSDEERSALEPEVRDFEPALALFSSIDPLAFYRRIAALGLDLLRRDAWIVFETHAETGPLAREILIGDRYQDVLLENDYAGHPRILSGHK